MLLSIFGIVLLIIIIISYKISKREDKSLITSLIILIGFIGIEIFIENTTIQLLFFVCIITLIIYIVFFCFIPRLFYIKGKFLFTETKSEVWKDLKIDSTIVEKQEKN